jgi:ribose 5-phosphate isomerase B
MKVVVGADMYGFPLKLVVVKWLEDNGHKVTDVGTHKYEADEKIADYADAVAKAVAGKKADRGILLCKSGGFMCIRANRYPGVRAVMAQSRPLLKHDREASDANVLCFGAHFDTAYVVESFLQAFLDIKFEELPRRVKRLKLLDEPVSLKGVK